MTITALREGLRDRLRRKAPYTKVPVDTFV